MLTTLSTAARFFGPMREAWHPLEMRAIAQNDTEHTGLETGATPEARHGPA